MKRCYLLLIACCLFIPLSGNAADRAELAQLLAAIAGSPSEQVRFTEEKHSWILSEPVLSEGILMFDADTGMLTKQVLKPEKMSMSITGEQVKIVEADQQRRMNIPRYSPMHTLFTAIRALLAGDLSTLERSFAIEFQSAAQSWEMTLKPRNQELAGKLREIIVGGAGDRIDTIEIRMSNGDWQRMRLLH